MVVSALYIYPIKSLKGIKVDHAFVEEKGFMYDRRWMLIDENNNFITQRKHPHMALLDVAHIDHQFIVSSREHGYIEIPELITEGEHINVTVWDDEVDALLADQSISDWFTQALAMPCRLVCMPLESRRTIDPKYAKESEAVSFADGYPYLVIGQSSLDDLNSRLENDVEIERFRPSIVVKGAPPYNEDQWGDFSIGEAQFYGTKPCARCVLTTINPQTGEKGKEPLATLTRYRQKENKVLFGMNVIASKMGGVKVGDFINISTWK